MLKFGAPLYYFILPLWHSIKKKNFNFKILNLKSLGSTWFYQGGK